MISVMWWICLDLIYFSAIHAQCTGNGLDSCACNFIGACTWDTKTSTYSAFTAGNLKTFIPKVESFAKTNQVAEICEPGKIGIVYDCVNRVPLASTVVIKRDEYLISPAYLQSRHFRQSDFIGIGYQQQNLDYTKALSRKPCYEASNSKYFVEHNWWKSITTGGRPYGNPCVHNIAIHRGHLIAAQYKPKDSKSTFVFTNAFPQFGTLNSGDWNMHEQKLRLWANKNCQTAPIHIIVGVIPSTYGLNDFRFVGQAGFSNYDGLSKRSPADRPYRINMVAFVYTAACCQTASFTKNTAFYSPNKPGKKLVMSIKLSDLFRAMKANYVDLFPGEAKCTNDKNFIGL